MLFSLLRYPPDVNPYDSRHLPDGLFYPNSHLFHFMNRRDVIELNDDPGFYFAWDSR